MNFKIKPLDLIFFTGNEFISNTIRFLEKKRLGKNAGKYSHVGLIVTSEILDHPKIKKNKLYIWESTMSGFLGNEVYNIDGKSFFGSQVRDFDQILNNYSNVYWSKFTIIVDFELIKEKFTLIFNKYNNIPYDANIFSLLGSLFPCMRYVRDHTEFKFINENWLFCSELCFKVYQELDYYDKKFDPRNVVPEDFLGLDEDGIPKLFEDPIEIN